MSNHARLAAIKATATKAAPDVSVTLDGEDEGVYVNFDFDSALWLTPNPLTPKHTDMFGLHWDRTHALDQEHFIGTFDTLDALAKGVRAFLREEEKHQRELDEMLNRMEVSDYDRWMWSA